LNCFATKRHFFPFFSQSKRKRVGGKCIIKNDKEANTCIVLLFSREKTQNIVPAVSA